MWECIFKSTLPINHYIGNTSIPMTVDIYQWGNVMKDKVENKAIINKFYSNYNYKVIIHAFHHDITLAPQWNSLFCIKKGYEFIFEDVE